MVADQYLSDLQIEIKGHADLFRDREFESVYIGGGTPTTLSSEQLSRLFAVLGERLRFAKDAEITVEANPITVSVQGLSHLKMQGVTRLSIGVQSFSDDILAVLGRAHTAGQAVTALKGAREAGFSNIGIDLIFGIPGQTGGQWRETLNTAISLHPDHIAAYSLSLDDGSRLARDVAAGRIDLPSDDAVADMYCTALDDLRLAGYEQYEISNFSLPGRACRHNINYWDRGEYLGLGPGAWSFIGNRRFANIADIKEYSTRLRCGLGAVAQEEFLDQDQAALETLLLGLRKNDGIDLETYGMLAGARALDKLKHRIKELDGADLFRIRNGILRLTGKGCMLSTEALARVIP